MPFILLWLSVECVVGVLAFCLMLVCAIVLPADDLSEPHAPWAYGALGVLLVPGVILSWCKMAHFLCDWSRPWADRLTAPGAMAGYGLVLMFGGPILTCAMIVRGETGINILRGFGLAMVTLFLGGGIKTGLL